MSAPQAFPDLPAALAAYAAGRCRRWVRVDGWQIDMHAAANPSTVSRPADERMPIVPGHVAGPLTREQHDHIAAACIAAELSRPIRPCAECHDPGCRRSTHLTLTDRATGEEYRATKCEEAALRREVLPALAVPSEPAPDASADRCPWCSRAWDGAR